MRHADGILFLYLCCSLQFGKCYHPVYTHQNCCSTQVVLDQCHTVWLAKKRTHLLKSRSVGTITNIIKPQWELNCMDECFIQTIHIYSIISLHFQKISRGLQNDLGHHWGEIKSPKCQALEDAVHGVELVSIFFPKFCMNGRQFKTFLHEG